MRDAGLFSMQTMGLINQGKSLGVYMHEVELPHKPAGKREKKVRHHLRAVSSCESMGSAHVNVFQGSPLKPASANPRKGRCPQVCFIIPCHPSSLATMTVAVFEKGKGGMF